MTDKTVTTTEVVEKPKATHTVLDNTDLAAVLADARGEPRPEKVEKPAEKVEAKKEVKADPDDLGLTEEELKDDALTATVRKAVDRKHRKFREAEEFAQSQFNEKQLANKRAEVLERENARLKEQLAPKVTEEAKEPERANFKTDEEYINAKIDYRADLKIKAKEKEAHEAALEDRKREVIASANARIDAARETGPEDFEEVLKAAEGPEYDVPVDVAGYMQESEMFAELAYHLSSNPEVIANIRKLPPAKQLVAIGKIESTLKPFSEKSEKVTTPKGESEDGKAKADPSTNAKPASKARPEPILPIETGSVSQVTKPASEMTYEETRAKFEKSHKVNLHARQRH